MNTLRQAAQQALKALEEINKLSIGENAICLPAEIDDAMDALRTALAKPEQEPVAWGMPDARGNIVDTITEYDRLDGMKQWADQYSISLYTAPPHRKPLTDEISTSTHFLPKPKTYGCDPNEFTEPCKHFLIGITNKSAAECPYCEIDKWKTNYAKAMDVNANLRAKIAERSAEHLAAHITYDKGYQAGRDDTKDAEDAFNRGIEAAQQRLMQMHRIASERHNLYGHAALELAKLKEVE